MDEALLGDLVQVTAALADGVVVRCDVAEGTPNGWFASDQIDDPLSHAFVPVVGGQLLVPVRRETSVVRIRFSGRATMAFMVDGQAGSCRELPPTPLSAVTGEVHGADGRPLDGVRVVGCGDSTFTGPDGGFALLEAEVGACRVEVIGCDKVVIATQQLDVPEGHDLLDVRIRVLQEPCPPAEVKPPQRPELELAECVLLMSEGMFAEFDAAMSPGAAPEIAAAQRARDEQVSPAQRARCAELIAAIPPG
ncbi:MAG: hypothetical protein V4850_27930 [Myxococcota bacterium]